MTKKASFAASMAAEFQKKPSLAGGGGVALATGLLLLMMGFFAPIGLSAQNCQPNDPANFNFTLAQFSCEVDFAATYAGSGTVTHAWQFYEQPTATGPFSTSNLANPLHTFDALSQTRLVVHTITITQNGQVTTHTCSRIVDANCDGCNQALGRFTYAVNGCVVTFTAINPSQPAAWTFGDGATGNGTTFTHNYGSNGDFLVQLTQNGSTCAKRIRTLCGGASCCTAAFTGNITRECGILCLNLDSDCDLPTGHSWQILNGAPCLTAVNLTNAPNQTCVQLTNINTQLTTSVRVKHTFICPDGEPAVETVDIPIPANALNSIFIGIRQDNPTKLTDYECVLPGFQYPANVAVVAPLPVYVSGIVQVDKSKPFIFQGAEIRMDPGLTGFDVLESKTLRLRQNGQGVRTTVHAVPDCDCLWRGNYALAKSTILTDGAIIEDAVFAIRAHGKSTLGIQRTDFNRNFVGIMASNASFTLQAFNQNVFDGAGPLRGICNAQLEGVVGDVNPYGGGVITYLRNLGFAGIYLDRAGTLNLIGLPFNLQNIFQNLAVGIDAYNTNLNIQRNSRFRNIHGNVYAQRGGAAVRLSDDFTSGANSIVFRGNGRGSVNTVIDPDFSQCTYGIHIFSQVPGNSYATSTRLEIADNRMANMQTGVYLEALGGTFAGRGATMHGPFRGIFMNRITLTNDFEFSIKSGIWIDDRSPTRSEVEIRNNIINVNYNTLTTGTESGVFIIGNEQNTTDNPVQYDINRNTILLQQNAAFGIAVSSGSEVWVHDNNNSVVPVDAITNPLGGGVFVNPIPAIIPAGIFFQGSRENLASCNDIVALGTIGRMLWSIGHEDGVLAQNRLISQGINQGGTNIASSGAEFTGICGTATQFRCNQMESNNGIGLRYGEGARTGDQGDPGNSFGNRWTGTFQSGWGAVVGGSLQPPVNSRFFVRGNTTENPGTNVSGWFFPTVTNAPACPTCPITVPFPPPPAVVSVNGHDTEIADDSAQYPYYPTASAWWAQQNLYRKLLRYSTLRQGNALMQGFFSTKSGTASGQLVDAVSATDNLFAMSNSQLNAMEDLQVQIDIWSAQLVFADSVMYATSDSAALVGLTTQHEWLSDSISVKQAEMQVILAQIAAQRLIAAPAVLASINAVTTTNAYEANTKTVLAVHVRTTALGEIPSTTDLNTLASIGTQCPFVAGPVVYFARSLYAAFTGTLLAESPCPPNFGEPGSEDRGSQPSVSTGFSLLPNPANDLLTVRSDTAPAGLSILNGLGQIVFRVEVLQTEQVVDISRLVPGFYLVRLERIGQLPIAQSLIIHR